MRKYCKAYHLKDLKQFSSWTERPDENGVNLSDDDVVYLWDDFTVVSSPVISDKGLIFDEITPEWQKFCTETLKFEIPEDLRYAYKQPEKQDDTSREASDARAEAPV